MSVCEYLNQRLLGRLTGAACAAALFAVICGEAGAQERKNSPWEVFQLGFSAYKSGKKDEAVEAYKYAAENGQIGAKWKLGRMYAEGDGVRRDDYEAYKFFSAIAGSNVTPGSPEESYVSDALVALGGYTKRGIPGTEVKADPIAAQDYYMRAASSFGNAQAQFEVGRMYLSGEGVKRSVKQAGQWLQLAAEKQHAGAQAILGNLLYQRGKIVRGLAMMTAALERAAPGDRSWIRGMQEEAFALSAESDRRTAIGLSQDILATGQ